jgi:hypothetical protein
MRSLKLGVAAIAVMCALSATAEAGDCVKIAAIGDGLTHDLAVIMSTHGLANIIDSKGVRAKVRFTRSASPARLAPNAPRGRRLASKPAPQISNVIA